MEQGNRLARIKKVTPKKAVRKTNFEVHRAIDNYKTSRQRQKAKRKLLQTFKNPPAFSITYDELALITVSIVFLDNKEIPALYSYGRKAKNLVEIGAAFGGSTSILLASIPKTANLTSIDPFVEDSMGPWSANEARCRQSVARLLRAVGRSDKLERWSLIVKPSYEAVKKWKKEVDFIFIDGDHNYKAVKNDFEDWLPHVKKGGLILIHDSRRVPGTPVKEYNRGWPGPTKLAKELQIDRRIALANEVHSITIWQKI